MNDTGTVRLELARVNRENANLRRQLADTQALLQRTVMAEENPAVADAYDAHVGRWADWALQQQAKPEPQTINPLLSIAIPTYNRPRELCELLEQLIRECQPFNVPIYVSDNASPYDFFALIEKMHREYPHIYARRSVANLGMGANILAAAAMPQTEYVWLFSDDDRMALGAVKCVLDECQSRHYDLIIPDREIRRADLKYHRGRTMIPPGAFVFHNEPAALFERAAATHFSFIGCLVFRRDTWNQARRHYEDDPYLPQLSTIAEMMTYPNTKAKFMFERLIYVRGGDSASWSPHALAVWWYWLPRAIWRVPGYSWKSKLRALSRAWDVQLYALWLTVRRVLTWRSDRSSAFLWGATIGAFVVFVMVMMMVRQ